jgi:hypothetical protein
MRSIMEELGEGSRFSDADFNARAPQPPERVPTYREYKFHNTTWFIIAFLTSFLWVNFNHQFVFPLGLMISLAMGLMLRDHARGAAHPFEFPLFILTVAIGTVVGGWLHFVGVLF